LHLLLVNVVAEGLLIETKLFQKSVRQELLYHSEQLFHQDATLVALFEEQRQVLALCRIFLYFQFGEGCVETLQAEPLDPCAALTLRC